MQTSCRAFSSGDGMVLTNVLDDIYWAKGLLDFSLVFLKWFATYGFVFLVFARI